MTIGANTPTLSARDGEIWAFWPDGRGAINLGSEQSFWAAAEKLFDELHPETPPVAGEQEPLSTAGEAEPEPAPSPRTEVERSEARHEVTIVGRVHGHGGSREVTIFDLSSHGCRVEDRALPKPGSHITIKIGSIGPIGAIVRWRRDAVTGLKFEYPLYPAILQHIRDEVSLR